jgi:5-deoxy-D-glucuronate isomerase
MRVIDADPGNMIDLPGVGPCPRPVDIHQGLTGFTTLKTLRIYRFAAGVTIDGESEGDEVWIVPLEGEIAMAITGAHPLAARLSLSDALYMPPYHGYRLTPSVPATVAYARAAAQGLYPTQLAGGQTEHLAQAQVYLAEGEALVCESGAERLIHVAAGRLAVAGRPVIAGQTLALAAGEAAPITAAMAAQVLVVSA